MKKIALAVFILSVIGTLVHELIGVPLLFAISKPLIVVSLLAYYYVASQREDRSPTFVIALLACLAGDIFLMDPDYFIPGLVSFLIGHVLYIFSYRQHQSEDDVDSLRGIQRVRLAFPIILAGTGLVVILYPVLGDLQIPVMIYAAVITAMTLTALFRYGRTNTRSFWLVFSGAALFMISDSVLAFNKFLEPITNAGLYIMLTYMAAQFLIVEGILKHASTTEVGRIHA
ncbi:MAG TPA: lysoplasmalogenase [Chryseosolibacter sp.]